GKMPRNLRSMGKSQDQEAAAAQTTGLAQGRRSGGPPAGAVASAAPTKPSERTLQRTVRDDQICVLTFDRPGSAANIFDQRTLTELGEELDFIARAPQLKGLIITSAKRSIFVAGLDLNLMTEAVSAE